jgi:hypothetical protein
MKLSVKKLEILMALVALMKKPMRKVGKLADQPDAN